MFTFKTNSKAILIESENAPERTIPYSSIERFEIECVGNGFDLGVATISLYTNAGMIYPVYDGDEIQANLIKIFNAMGGDKKVTNDEARHKFNVHAVNEMFKDTGHGRFRNDVIREGFPSWDEWYKNSDCKFLDTFDGVYWEDMPEDVANHVKKVTLKVLGIKASELEDLL